MPFFKTENGNAENIKYDDTKSVKEVIDDIKDTAMFIDSFNTDTGTLNTTSESGSSSGSQTASSVTFDNTDTGLEAANVQDAIEEVNGKLAATIAAVYFKNYGGIYQNPIDINIGAKSAIIVSSNAHYGVGGIWYAQYVKDSDTVNFQLICGNTEYTSFTNKGNGVVTVVSNAANYLYVAVF